MPPIIKLILGYVWFTTYYGIDFFSQTIADSGTLEEFIDYAQNKYEKEGTEEMGMLFWWGLFVSALAAFPYTLTVIAVRSGKHHHPTSHADISYKALAQENDIELVPLLVSQSGHEDSDNELAITEQFELFEQHNTKPQQSRFSLVATAITRAGPYGFLVYGASCDIGHYKFFKNTNEIVIQIACVTLAGINAKNRYDLHTHHANAKESYWTLLMQLSLKNKFKGAFLTFFLVAGHICEGWFSVKYGTDGLAGTLYHFGVPRYFWLPWLGLAANVYFTGSLVINATRTEGGSTLRALKQEEENETAEQQQPQSHWVTEILLWLASGPQGLMPALGAIQLLNLATCAVNSSFTDLTSECPDNLTNQFSFWGKMLIFAGSYTLLGYSAGTGARETCRKATDEFVRKSGTEIIKAATKSWEYVSAAKETLSQYSTARFFKSNKTTKREENNIELALINMPDEINTFHH